MSSGEVEKNALAEVAAAAPSSSSATQSRNAKITVLQEQLMIPGRGELQQRHTPGETAASASVAHTSSKVSSIKILTNYKKRILIAEVGTARNFGETTLQTEKRMRMKVTGEDANRSAATRGQAVSILDAVNPSTIAHNKTSVVETNDPSRLSTPEVTMQTVPTDSSSHIDKNKIGNPLTDSPSFVILKASSTIVSNNQILPTPEPMRQAVVAEVSSGDQKREAVAILHTVTPTNVICIASSAPSTLANGETVAVLPSFARMPTQHLVKKGCSNSSFEPQPQHQQAVQTAAAVTKTNTKYKVVPDSLKGIESLDNAGRNSVVLRKLSNGAWNNSSSLTKSTSDCTVESGGSSSNKQENDKQTVTSTTVESETVNADELTTAKEYGPHEQQVTSQLKTHQKEAVKDGLSSTLDEHGKAALDRDNIVSSDVKLSREVKLLKDTQSQSKVLAEYIDEASRQGKLRKRRSTSGTPTSTMAIPQVTPVASATSQRNYRQSRSFPPEDDPSLGSSNKRTGMRSENADFKLKQQKFLNDIHDKGDMSLTDESEDEQYVHFQNSVASTDDYSSSRSDLNVTTDSKRLDDSLSSAAYPPKPGSDRYCFRCRRKRADCLVACSTCIRSFHKGCVRSAYTDEKWSCHECKLSILAHETNPFPTEGDVNLYECLKYALETLLCIPDMHRLFNPLDTTPISSYDSNVTNHMDLAKISSNVEARTYITTEEFLADLSWIVHNMSLFAENTKLQSAAKTLYKAGKQQVLNIETCRECFVHLYSKPDTWFQEACKKPHLLVWAKLKGFPYWPGKLMSINGNNQADVRFFGDHDRAWVSVKDCYLFSNKDPNSKPPKRPNWNESLAEAYKHVENIISRFGSFNYAPYQKLIDAVRIDDHLREMVPKAFEEVATSPGTESVQSLKLKIVKNHGKMTALSKPSTDDLASINASEISTGTESADSRSSSQSRITRRASRAAAAHQDDACAVSPIVTPPANSDSEKSNDREVSHQVVAKKRKSVCFEQHILDPDDGGKIEPLLLHRNSGSWASERIPKRRKSFLKALSFINTGAQEHSNASPSASDEFFDSEQNTVTADEPVDDSPLVTEPMETSPHDENGTVGPRETSAVINQSVSSKSKDGPADVEATANIAMEVTRSLADNNAELAEQETNERIVNVNGGGEHVQTDKHKKQSAVPGPIKVECLDALDEVSSMDSMSTSAMNTVDSPQQAVRPVVTLLTKISASNQKARKSFPGSSAAKAAVPVGKLSSMMTIIPKAIAPESNSPILLLEEETVPTTNAAIPNGGSNTSATNTTVVAPVPVSADKILQGVVITPTEVPSATAKRLPTSLLKNYQTVNRAVRASTSLPIIVASGPGCLPGLPLENRATKHTNACSNLPVDLDVIVLADDEPDAGSAPVPHASNGLVSASTPVKNMTRQNRPPILPVLQPKPSARDEREDFSVSSGDRSFSLTDMLDDYANLVAEQSRTLFERTLNKFAHVGSHEAKLTELTLQLEQERHQHTMEIEQLNKQHATQVENMRQNFVNDKQRAVARAKKTMWCRRCQVEANFYCCWSTAYCSRKCQIDHWPEHQSCCEQLKKGARTAAATNASVLTPQAVNPGGSVFFGPYNPSAKRRAHAQPRQRSPGSSSTSSSSTSLGGYPDQSSTTTAVTVTTTSKILPTLPAGQRAQNSAFTTTPKILNVYGHATNFDNLPYASFAGGGYAGHGQKSGALPSQRRVQSQTGAMSTAVRDLPAGDFNGERRLQAAGQALTSNVSTSTIGRMISTAPVAGTLSTITLTRAGRGGTISTSRAGAPPPGGWNQIIVQSSPAAPVPTGGTFVDSSAMTIVGPRGGGGPTNPAIVGEGYQVPSTIGTVNNSAHADARLVPELIIRRHAR